MHANNSYGILVEISWEIHANMYGEIIKNSYEILMNLSSTRGETDDEFDMKLLWILHMNYSHEFHVKFVMKSSYKFSHEIHEIFSHEFHENFDGGFIWISYQIHELCLLGNCPAGLGNVQKLPRRVRNVKKLPRRVRPSS